MLDDENTNTNGAPELPGINITKLRRRKDAGRKTADGSVEVMKLRPLKDACPELMKLYKRFEEAKLAFNGGITSVAESSNVNASTLKKLIVSSANGKFEDTRRAIEQASIIFEEVGEVPGGSVTNSDDDE